MRFLLFSLAILLAESSWADSLNLNGQPLFWTFANQDPKYHDAAFKAQEAFLLQTGITPSADKLNSYFTDKANNAVTAFINHNMPFSADQAYSVIGAVYVVGVKKQISQSFPDPIWNRVRYSVSISSDSGSTSVSIPF